MSRPDIAVLIAPGTNRDGEAVRALELAGARAQLVHTGEPLEPFAGVVIPGGFSYGDALGAGMRWALEAGESVGRAVSAGGVVLGICNGFQVLVRSGLLPGGDQPSSSDQPSSFGARHGRQVTLTANAGGHFVCRWVALGAEPGNAAGLHPRLAGVIACPVAHGEGRLATTHPSVVEDLQANGQILFRYVEGTNPNGSVADIAGLCDRTGRVWGLMPHPEDHLTEVQNPFPHRPGRAGLALFQAFVDRART
ncbi:MAG: phosphoribosylformylglycinamidine synthase I [Acidimicrobiales bacterium]